jgi:hypothetical protein
MIPLGILAATRRRDMTLGFTYTGSYQTWVVPVVDVI